MRVLSRLVVYTENCTYCTRLNGFTMRSDAVHLNCKGIGIDPTVPQVMVCLTSLPLVILLYILTRESTPVGAHNHTFPGGKSLLQRRDTSGVLAPALSSGNTFHPRHRWWISGSHHFLCERSCLILDRDIERFYRNRIAVAILVHARLSLKSAGHNEHHPQSLPTF